MLNKETKLGQNFHRTYETLQMYEFKVLHDQKTKRKCEQLS